MALIQCPECGQQISDTAKYCVHCGVEVKVCPECGKVISGSVVICPSCGMDCSKRQEAKKPINSVAKENATENDKEKIVKGLLDETAREREIRATKKQPPRISVLQVLALPLIVMAVIFGFVCFRTAEIDYEVSFIWYCLLTVTVIMIVIMFSIDVWIGINRESREFELYGNGYMRYIYPRLETYKQLMKLPWKNASEEEKIFLSRLGGMIGCVATLQNPEGKKKAYLELIVFPAVFTVVPLLAGLFLYKPLYDFFENLFPEGRAKTYLLLIFLITLIIVVMIVERKKQSAQLKRNIAWIDTTIEKLKTEGNPYEAEENEEESANNSLGASANGGTPSVPVGKKQKNKVTALLLCIFLGDFGVHRFYEGKIGTGLLYLFTFGLFGVGVIVDLIRLIRTPNPYYV